MTIKELITKTVYLIVDGINKVFSGNFLELEISQFFLLVPIAILTLFLAAWLFNGVVEILATYVGGVKNAFKAIKDHKFQSKFRIIGLYVWLLLILVPIYFLLFVIYHLVFLAT